MESMLEIFKAPTTQERLANRPPTEFIQRLSFTWDQNSKELAEWTEKHLVNRFDAYGEYYNSNGKSGNCKSSKGELTTKELINHYSGLCNRVALYSYGKNGFGKWLCIDIDAHEGEDLKNWEIVLEILEVLDSWGVTALCEHTNGMCGFHIWILFDTPVKLATLKSIGDFLIAGRGTHEVFPKQSVQKDYGNYVRLPGRHHKNTNWHSDFYDFEFNKWHRGADAVQFMLDLYINTIEDVSVEAKTFTPPERISSNGDNGSFEGSGAETYLAYKGAINSLDIVALSKDRLTGRVSGSKHDVVCPWDDQHTTDTGGTCICEADADRPPAFICLHSHCQHRKLVDYLGTFPVELVDSHCSRMKTIVLPENYEDKIDNCLNGKKSEADDQDSFDLDGLYDGLEMLRRSKDSKSEFLFDGLLESGVITLLCGLPYSGKSLVVLQLLVKLLSSKPFYGHDCKSKPVPVLYVNADRLRDRQFDRRLCGVCGDDSLYMSILPWLYFTECDDLPATLTDDYLTKKVQTLKRKHKSESVVVIIDTLRPAFLLEQKPGAENDPGVISKLLTPIRSIAKNENLAVMLLHHNNRSRDDYSGSAAIAGSTDSIWTITKKDNTATMNIANREGMPFKMEVILGPKVEDVEKAAADLVETELREFIAKFPGRQEAAITRDEAAKMFPDMSETSFRTKLSEAERAGTHPRLDHTGSGKKGSPYRYFVV